VRARIAGAFYLFIFVAGVFTEFFVRGRLVVNRNAAATSANILAHPSLYRLGGAVELLILTCDIAVALIFYDLLKPVSRGLSLSAAVFRLVFVAIMAANSLNYFAPLMLLRSARSLTAFSTDQLQGMALASLQSYGVGYETALVFFGFHCLLISYLIFRSAFLPRTLGILMALAGLGWLAYLWPPFANSLSPYILMPGAFGEGSLTLWLLVVGVNAQQWNKQAGAMEEP
jgi:hypothetical protein